MADKKWTDEQLLAINTTDKTLLISAAAGSGKTATLTERIIRSILNPPHMDIRRMLIVTFTNAAVEELRQRIQGAIKKALEENPNNTILEEQLLAVKGARIMTIDAFCNSVVKASAEEVGIQPNYRIADGAEEELMLTGIMNELIELAYDGKLPEVATAEEFASVAECLTSTRGERSLADVFKKIYSNTETIPEGADALFDLTDEFDPAKFTSVDETKFGKLVVKKAKEAFRAYKEAYVDYETLEFGSNTEQKGFVSYKLDMDLAEKCLNSNSYAEIREAILNFAPMSLPGGKGERGDLYKHLSILHPDFTKTVKDLYSDYFSYTEEQWRELYEGQYRALSVICRFLRLFEKVFSDEKKKKGIASYADIEKYAYRALYDENGEPSAIARDLREENDAVYIDEYQDVNRLQSKIFDAVSKENNRFMVGDIKQSIYGFRSAKPEIFAKMKDSFPELKAGEGGSVGSLFMSQNFRCDETIIEFTNGIFDKAFSLWGESIGYVEKDRLKFKKIYEDGSSPNGAIPEIHITPAKPRGAKVQSLMDGDIEESESDFSYDVVAEKVKELTDSHLLNNGKPITPSDIAIIIRSDSGRAEKLKNALSKVGIKAQVPNTTDFFLNEEVLLALSLLSSIDNPRKDVYLAALMLSPLYGFTADDLVKIRKNSEKEVLYEAISDYSKKEDVTAKKAKSFLSKLEEYRMLSEGITVDELLGTLYRETGILTLAASHGRKNNLILLHDLAKRHESGAFKGLYSFISYINEIITENKKVDLASVSADDTDAVRIITAHKSKGLEFPVTIYACAGTKPNRGNDERIIFEEGFGFAMLLKDNSGLSLVENPVFTVISSYRSEKDFEEELRVLYVILTRARERLYIFGEATSEKCDNYLDKAEHQKSILSKYFFGKCTTPLLRLLVCNKTGKVIVHEKKETEKPAIDTENTETAKTTEASVTNDICRPENRAECDAAYKTLCERFSYKYPFIYHTKLPEKLSVSHLYPELLDGEMSEAPEEVFKDEKASRRIEIPEFISGKPSDESAKRGIATHTYLQFCDLSNLEKCGAKGELERLIENSFISKNDSMRVRLKEIDAFSHSPLFRKMKDSKELYRELRFNVKLPAKFFLTLEEPMNAVGNDELLVQGVIDCLYRDAEGKLHLVDYKTDRLTKEELDDPESGRRRLIETHKTQLGYYREAIVRIFGEYPSSTAIYSLHLGEEIFI